MFKSVVIVIVAACTAAPASTMAVQVPSCDVSSALFARDLHVSAVFHCDVFGALPSEVDNGANLMAYSEGRGWISWLRGYYECGERIDAVLRLPERWNWPLTVLATDDAQTIQCSVLVQEVR